MARRSRVLPTASGVRVLAAVLVAAGVLAVVGPAQGQVHVTSTRAVTGFLPSNGRAATTTGATIVTTFTGQNGLTTVGLNGVSIRPDANGRLVAPSISNSGATVAFASNSTNLVTPPTPLFQYNVYTYSSPSGQIVKAPNPVNVDGVPLYEFQVGPSGPDSGQVSVSPNGQFVAFVATDVRSSFNHAVYVWNRTTGAVNKVGAGTSSADALMLSWADDNSTIVYAAGDAAGSVNPGTTLWATSVTGPETLLSGAAPNALGPSVSANGRRVAYIHSGPDGTRANVLDRDTGSVTQLPDGFLPGSSGPGNVFSPPQISPDGSLVAYCWEALSGGSGVYVHELSTGLTTGLLSFSGCANMDFTSDSSSLVVGSRNQPTTFVTAVTTIAPSPILLSVSQPPATVQSGSTVDLTIDVGCFGDVSPLPSGGSVTVTVSGGPAPIVLGPLTSPDPAADCGTYSTSFTAPSAGSGGSTQLSIAASYTPSGTAYAATTSQPVSVLVAGGGPVPTATTASAAPATGLPFTSTEITCTVTPNLPGTFFVRAGALALGSVPVRPDGTGTLTTGTLGAGEFPITCEYLNAGGTGLNSTSPPIVIVRTGGTGIPTTVSVAEVTPPVGQPLAATTITCDLQGIGGVPSGILTFSADGVSLGSVPVTDSGPVPFQTSAIGAGDPVLITCQFTGTPGVAQDSSSGPFPITRGDAPPVTSQVPAISVDPVDASPGTATTVTCTVIASGGPAEGELDIVVAGNVNATIPVTASGPVTFTTAAIPSGSFIPVVCVFRGSPGVVSDSASSTVYLTRQSPPLPPPATTTIGSLGTGQDGVPIVRRGVPTPLSVQACPGGVASFTVRDSSGAAVATGSLRESAPLSGRYVTTIPAVTGGAGTYRIDVVVVCLGGSTDSVDFDARYIDPSGTVVDTQGEPIPGATVILERREPGSALFVPVVGGSTIMSPDNRVNPWTTGSDGIFRWDVVAGDYRLLVEKAGCTVPGTGDPTLFSPVYSVPPPAVDLVFTLDCGSSAPAPVRVLTSRDSSVAGLMAALDAVIPELDVVTRNESTGLYEHPGCVGAATWLPASDADLASLLAGDPYATSTGFTNEPVTADCRPDAVSAFS